MTSAPRVRPSNTKSKRGDGRKESIPAGFCPSPESLFDCASLESSASEPALPPEAELEVGLLDETVGDEFCADAAIVTKIKTAIPAAKALSVRAIP
jgi:hypothetical protein